MQKDLIRYDLLVQDALKGVVRKVLGDAARDGLPGDHHFYVSFRTDLPGVRVSNRLREKYPEEMTIVLQHQFWDLGITEHGFEVGLSFSGVPERLLVPYDAVTGFFDPSVQFGLKFEVKDAAPKAETDQDTAETLGTDAFADTGSEPLPPVKETSRQGKERHVERSSARPTERPQERPQERPLPRSPAKPAKAEAAPPPDGKGEANKGGSAKDVAKDDTDKSGAEVVSLDSFRKKH
jgi:uncharacterized protein